MRPRLNEIFSLVGGIIKKSSFAGSIPAGIVLTGGGSLTASAPEACKRVLQLPVRLGIPSGLSGLTEEIDSPAYSTAVGLILFGYNSENISTSPSSSFNFKGVFKKLPFDGAGKVGKKVTNFVKSFLP